MSTPDSDEVLGQTVARALRELPDVPTHLERAAIGLFAAATHASSAPPVEHALWRRIAAALSFDSWAAPALAHGMRAVGSTTRHLLFTAEGRDIDLRIASLPHAAYALSGQILGPDETGEVELEHVGAEGGPPRRSVLDSLGEFRIDGLDRGVYLLTIKIGGEQIVLPPLELGEPTR